MGCGNGGNFHLLPKAGYILGIDIDHIYPNDETSIKPELPELIHVESKASDILEYPLEENFDLIISVYVLWDRLLPRRTGH